MIVLIALPSQALSIEEMEGNAKEVAPSGRKRFSDLLEEIRSGSGVVAS